MALIQTYDILFVAVVNVLLPTCRHIGSCMPNLRKFVKDIVALLASGMTDKWVGNLVCSGN